MSRLDMSPRERILVTLEFQEPDRVPIDFGGDQTGINVQAYQGLTRFLGFREEYGLIHEMGQVAQVNEHILKHFKVDTRYIFPEALEISSIQEMEREGERYLESTDEWGVVRSKPRDYGHWFDITHHPLREATIEDLDNYPWPDPADPKRFQGLRKKAKNLFVKTDYAVATGVNGSLFEMGWYLCGMDRFLQDMILDPPFINRLLDILLEYWLSYFKAYLKEVGDCIHIVNLGDDLGTQVAPLISPQLYRSLIKPRQKELFQTIHKQTDARLWFHTCGSIINFIPDFIEIGIDILNPLQTTAKGMDAGLVKKEFGRQIVFWGGGCDTQKVLPFGSAQDVENDVKNRIQVFSPGGGYVFCQIHDIPVEAPPENICAMFNAAFRYGRYAT